MDVHLAPHLRYLRVDLVVHDHHRNQRGILHTFKAKSFSMAFPNEIFDNSSEPSVVLVQMMNGMAVEQPRRRDSREFPADSRRQSRIDQVDTRRNSRESRGIDRHYSREEAPLRRPSSRDVWPPSNEAPQNIQNRESRDSRDERRIGGPPRRRSSDSRKRSRDCFPNLHYQN